jgi:hypothetical protein
MAFFTQSKAKLCKNLIMTLVFEKSAIFSAENCRKSPKIVIITFTLEQNFAHIKELHILYHHLRICIFYPV